MPATKPDLDSLDLDIIEHLQEDGRRSYREIAQDLGVTERTIRLRVNQLRDRDVLQIVGVVNPIEFGLQVGAVIQLAVSEAELQACVDKLQTLTSVRFVTLTSGEYQLLIQVIMQSYHELSLFIQSEMPKLPGLRSTNTIVQLDVLKNEFRIVRRD